MALASIKQQIMLKKKTKKRNKTPSKKPTDFINLFMKKHILLFTIFITTLCTGQLKYGSVQYGKITNKEITVSKESPVYKDVTEWITKLNTEADKVEYTLNFTAEEAYFYANPILIDNDGITFSLAATIGRGKIKHYQNKITNENRDYKDSQRTGKIIVNGEKKEWTILNETKKIDGYTCFKATTPYLIDEDGRVKENVFFTAWFSPEIPISFGPAGYGGLPGLILELQTDKATFFVKKINLSLDKIPEIDKLTSPKAITMEAYLEIVRGTYTKEQSEGIKKLSK